MRWEYHIDSSMYDHQMEGWGDWMGRMGQQGWELVTIWSNIPIFKRPLPDPPPADHTPEA